MSLIPYLSISEFIRREGEKANQAMIFEKETQKKIELFIQDFLSKKAEPRFADIKLSGSSWHILASSLLKQLADAAKLPVSIRLSPTAAESLQATRAPMLESSTHLLSPQAGVSSISEIHLDEPLIQYNSYVKELPLGELAGAMAHELGHFAHDHFKIGEVFHPKVKKGRTFLRYYLVYKAEMRSQEYEADAFAVHFGLGRGFLAYLQRVLGNLPTADEPLRLNDRYYLFSNHPPLQSRIKKIENLIQKNY